jgi:hypothetical protein
LYFENVEILLTNKLHLFPEYLLKLSAVDAMYDEYLQQLIDKFQISYDVASALVYNYRADVLLNHSENLIILKRDPEKVDTTENQKPLELRVAFVSSIEEATSFIAGNITSGRDSKFHLDSENIFEPVYISVEGKLKNVCCRILEDKIEISLADKILTF